MLKVVESKVTEKMGLGESLLDQLVCDSARQMLTAELQADVAAYIDRFAVEVDEGAHRLVVRNGSHEPREVATGAGAATVTAPRVKDKRMDPRDLAAAAVLVRDLAGLVTQVPEGRRDAAAHVPAQPVLL